MWVAIHEVTHRVQFSSAPWLRGELTAMVDAYLRTVSLEPTEIVEQLGRAVEQLAPARPPTVRAASCGCSRPSSDPCSNAPRR